MLGAFTARSQRSHNFLRRDGNVKSQVSRELDNFSGYIDQLESPRHDRRVHVKMFTFHASVPKGKLRERCPECFNFATISAQRPSLARARARARAKQKVVIQAKISSISIPFSKCDISRHFTTPPGCLKNSRAPSLNVQITRNISNVLPRNFRLANEAA